MKIEDWDDSAIYEVLMDEDDDYPLSSGDWIEDFSLADRPASDHFEEGTAFLRKQWLLMKPPAMRKRNQSAVH
jgi:hypothetical protein